jgi:hypothetical protein
VPTRRPTQNKRPPPANPIRPPSSAPRAKSTPRLLKGGRRDEGTRR